MPKVTTPADPLPLSDLRPQEWPRFLRGPDQDLLDKLYVPALERALRYDRCCAYFSSSALAVAARGFGRFIERLIHLGEAAPKPAIRLLVNEELAQDDVRALLETGENTTLTDHLLRRFKSPRDVLEKQRLAMLGWLYQHGYLDLRVGIMRHGSGIVHAKFGIIHDATGKALVFSGSGNESAQGMTGNYERLELSTSWRDEERYQEYQREFEALWNDQDAAVHTVSLPEALRLKLIKFAPRQPPPFEPSTGKARQQAAMLWRFIAEAPYLHNGARACDATAFVNLWPHQQRVVEETAAAWPDGRLLCDEVGMGKTIEAMLTLRRLLAGRGVVRVLVLLPAGLLLQWQTELREKGGLLFPRLDGPNTLIWPDGCNERCDNLAAALQQNLLLMSRETARTENNLPILLAARPWDLIVLDEAHAARRKKQEESEYNTATLLLELLRQLQLKGRVRSFLLLSATPMQTQPWEPWDLLAVLGEGGTWLADFATVRTFYRALIAVQNGRCTEETAQQVAATIASDPDFPPSSDLPVGASEAVVAQALAFPLLTQQNTLAAWLRHGSPLTRRMHRNTRQTLRDYYARGLLNQPPPVRRVQDVLFDFQDSAERTAYNAISHYIDLRFRELENERAGKGFVMTIYRRRAASSPYALQQSLLRRRESLERITQQRAYDRYEADDLDSRDLDDLGDFDIQGHIGAALPESPAAARRELIEVERLLDQLNALHGRDSKRDQFFEVIRQVTDDDRALLVFTEYADTLRYVRDNLISHFGERLGCYSGAGGEIWRDNTWHTVTKAQITAELRQRRLAVLLCTDAASEGLNLQTAGALINYDLPWNPSKVEQRIGRLDRIGQRYAEVRIVNLFLKDSIDERVYRVLRDRCGVFEHFVGPMQPVLAQARRMLLGEIDALPDALVKAAAEVDQDPLASEIYLQSEALTQDNEEPPLTRPQLIQALDWLSADFGLGVRKVKGRVNISGIPGTLATDLGELEADPKILPLEPLAPVVSLLVKRLERTGEQLPLVIGAYQAGAFRAAVALWLDGAKTIEIERFSDLETRLKNWNGTYPQPAQWVATERAAHLRARERVMAEQIQAQQRETDNIARQLEAAQLRLRRELGRYLVCLGEGTDNLNGTLYRHLSRTTATAARLKNAFEKLGGYPKWPPTLCQELEEFYHTLSDNQIKARLIGKELEAALADPRWLARQ